MTEASRTKPEVLYTQQEIGRRLAEIAGEVTATFKGTELCVVGLMKSCLVFMSDLIRLIPLDMTCHFLRASSLRDAGAARTDIIYSAEIPYEDRDILLLDAVLDTGITLNFLLDNIRERRPRSLRVCVLIDKPGERKVAVQPDWTAFALKEPLSDGRFLVGYGLDYSEYYRGLPYIGTIPLPAAEAEGRRRGASSGKR
jgi:hypoxanthine phosphoribosyltransferase